MLIIIVMLCKKTYVLSKNPHVCCCIASAIQSGVDSQFLGGQTQIHSIVPHMCICMKAMFVKHTLPHHVDYTCDEDRQNNSTDSYCTFSICTALSGRSIRWIDHPQTFLKSGKGPERPSMLPKLTRGHCDWARGVLRVCSILQLDPCCDVILLI